MDFFQTWKKIGENLRIIFGVFWCGIMNIDNNKILHDT
jgi:hypothetical protein